MKGAVLYGTKDIRVEDRDDPKIIEPTDAVLRLSASCICGSDLWPYRGLQPIEGPTHMGPEYCGIVAEVGSAVRSIKPGQFVVGSFATSANTCPHCQYGYQSACVHREFMLRAQARSCVCPMRTELLYLPRAARPHPISCRACLHARTFSAPAG